MKSSIYVALLLVAVCGCVEPAGPEPFLQLPEPRLPLPAPVTKLADHGRPDLLEFSWSAIFVRTWRIELRGDTVVLHSREADDLSTETTVRTVVDDAAWQRFWQTANGAGVQYWRNHYAAERIADGAGWSLRIGAGGRLVETSGSNAFPDRFGRVHSDEMPGSFAAFMNALLELPWP